MDFPSTGKALESIRTLCRNDELLRELTEEFLASAIRYARIRVDWSMVSPDERHALDDRRTRAHDSFIDNCNILARGMAKQGKDTEWRSDLGHDRKAIGDFACYIHAHLGLMAR